MLDKANISFSGDDLNLYETHLNDLPARRFFKFLEIVRKKQYETGEVLIDEGQDVDTVTFIMSGECSVYVRNQVVAKVDRENSCFPVNLQGARIHDHFA